MNTEKRGSEKLMSTCSGMTTLSQEELEKVAGAASLPYVSGSYGFWKVFPHGEPSPELFEKIAVQQLIIVEDSKPVPSFDISNGFLR